MIKFLGYFNQPKVRPDSLRIEIASSLNDHIIMIDVDHSKVYKRNNLKMQIHNKNNTL